MGIQSTHTVTCASHNIMHTVSTLSGPSLAATPGILNLEIGLYACMTVYCTVTPTSPLVDKCHISQIPIYPYPPLSIPPMLDYTSINLYIYTQCQLDLHYYAHLTPGKLSPSEAFLRLDQKGLDIRNRTRMMILPIPTNVRLFTISFGVLLTESFHPTTYTFYSFNKYALL
jgi:hypothetical protein